MDMSLFNAFVIWSQNDSSVAKKGYLDFLINLCQLIFDQKQATPIEIPHISNRVSLTHFGSSGQQRRCKVCSTMKGPNTKKNLLGLRCQFMLIRMLDDLAHQKINQEMEKKG